VFPTVAILIRDTLDRLSEKTRDAVFTKLHQLLRAESYIVMVPTNLAYSVRLLAHDQSEEADALLVRIHKNTSSLVIRRDVILAMARRGADYWLSKNKKSFASQSPWERVATVIASFMLEDEGTHWRRRVGGQLNGMEQIAADWAGGRKQSGSWEIPI
jgi:hypothetical protein